MRMMHQEKKNKRSKYSILRNTEQVDYNNISLQVQKGFKVLGIRDLTESTYVLRFTRNGMNFMSGQHIVLGIPGDNQTREYSIYSATDDDYLEVLVREVEDGLVSKRLRQLKEGDAVSVEGPFGFFSLDENTLGKNKYLFIATGTGIAPFHSMVGSHPQFNYKILHGVRYSEEAYEKEYYNQDNYTFCTSRDFDGDFHGRVTEYLESNEVDSDTLVYLCGNCDMIYEVYDLLTSRGMDSDQIRTEVYF